MPWHKLKNLVAVKDSKVGARVKDRKFLSELATDKHYLEGLIKSLGDEKGSDANRGTQGLVTELNSSLNFLNDRRDFWAQQQPDYPDDIKNSFKKPTPLDVLLDKVIP